MRSRPSAGPVCILAGAGSGRRRRSRAASQIRSRAGLSRRRDPRRAPSRTRPRARCARGSTALGVTGVARSHLPLGCARAAALLRRRAAAADPRLEGASSEAHRKHSARGRYRFRPAADLATEIEWAKNRRITPDDYLALARRSRAADPARPHAARLPRVRAAQGRAGLGRLRGSARAARSGSSTRTRRARAGARPLPRLHRRRVPGRQPPPADAARPLARRPGRALRRSATTTSRSTRSRARRPSYLLVDAAAVPERDGRPARGELPLDPEVLELREPARAAARRCGEGRCAPRDRPAPSRSRVPSGARARGGLPRRADPRACTRTGRPTRRWRSSSGRTRARPTTKRRCSEAEIPSQGRRCSHATARGSS